MAQYIIGLDFGSLSGRGALIDTADGSVFASADMSYAHGIIDREFPAGSKLPSDWALQHPRDFLEVLTYLLQSLGKLVPPETIRGIGIDCTGSSVLPVGRDGMPLCFTDEFRDNPYAYIMMWKHHVAQPYADRMTAVALERKEPWLSSYGGKVDAEWFFSKLAQLYSEAPAVYHAAAAEMEVGDWLVSLLTANYTRGIETQSAKALYVHRSYPDEEFFAAVDEGLRHCLSEKIKGKLLLPWEKAGTVTAEAAARFGIPEGIPVSPCNLDGHVCKAASGITDTGEMLGIIGTSAVFFAFDDVVRFIPGTWGMLEEGYLPGMTIHEAGQSSAGDTLGWFSAHLVPEDLELEAKEQRLSVQALLTRKASELKPGECGLVALDWLNGNRSILCNSELSGMIVGLTIRTNAVEVYRALMESVAFGTRMIVENFENHGVPVRSLTAVGGIPMKNTLLMQIYSDVLKIPVKVLHIENSSVLGSAVHASVAAGIYPDLKSAVTSMSPKEWTLYTPNAENSAVYDELWKEYKLLHDTFGERDSMSSRLKKLQAEARNRKNVVFPK